MSIFRSYAKFKLLQKGYRMARDAWAKRNRNKSSSSKSSKRTKSRSRR